jgi:hypothetical protein
MSTQSPVTSRRRYTDPSRPQSLTDPADMFALFGRFAAANIFFMTTVFAAFQGQYQRAIFCGVMSILLQIATIRLWRHLRDQRQQRLAEREAKRSAAVNSETAADNGLTAPPATSLKTPIAVGQMATARNTPERETTE